MSAAYFAITTTTTTGRRTARQAGTPSFCRARIRAKLPFSAERHLASRSSGQCQSPCVPCHSLARNDFFYPEGTAARARRRGRRAEDEERVSNLAHSRHRSSLARSPVRSLLRYSGKEWNRSHFAEVAFVGAAPLLIDRRSALTCKCASKGGRGRGRAKKGGREGGTVLFAPFSLSLAPSLPLAFQSQQHNI